MFLQIWVQYRASAVGKMKIEPVVISIMQNITSSNMADQNDYFIATESYKSFSVFLKFQMDGKWSECMNVTKLKKRKSQT